MKPESRFLETSSGRTHYLTAGEGDPLILIHGGGAGADGWGNWQFSLPYFTQRFRCFVMDMVGFGQSEGPDPATNAYSQSLRNGQLISFIEGLGLSGVSVIGNSMGGATAMGAAMQRPELFRNLVLMGSAGLTQGVSEALKPLIFYDFTIEGMRKVVQVLTNASFVPSEELINYRYELSVRPAVKRAYGATMGWIKEQGGLMYDEDLIRSVKTRTLVLNGKDDLVVPVEQAYRFLELLENSSGHILPHCGHWAMIEHPQTFARICIDFLEGYR